MKIGEATVEVVRGEVKGGKCVAAGGEDLIGVGIGVVAVEGIIGKVDLTS